ncbi:MAG: hypothetical protein ACKV2O_13260 [Acidimicrobiales bacterium]
MTAPSRRPSRSVLAWSVALAGLCLAGVGCGDTDAAVAAPDDRAAAAANLSSAVAALTAQTGLPATIITVDVNQVSDCAALALTLTPMLASLGDLSAEEANQLDQSLIAEIGTYLDAIEVRRRALNCDDATWKVARCEALTAADTSMAKEMARQFCSAQAPGTTPATPATATTVGATTTSG